jgi:hypothetical protein
VNFLHTVPFQTPEQKTAQLAALHKRTASHGVIHMTDDLYPYYALEHPRPYHLIALFTATVRFFPPARLPEVEGIMPHFGDLCAVSSAR